WRNDDPLMRAVRILRDLILTDGKALPTNIPVDFLQPKRRKAVVKGKVIDRQLYELAILLELCERLAGGDVWVEGSRKYRPWNEFLLPRAAFIKLLKTDQHGLAVPTDYREWIAGRRELLHQKLTEVNQRVGDNDLPDVRLVKGDLVITPPRN